MAGHWSGAPTGMVSRLNLDGMRDFVDVFRHRWDPIILVLIAERPRRRRELAQDVSDGRGDRISDGVLSEVLNRLQNEGMIVREKADAHHAVYHPTAAARAWVSRMQQISEIDNPPSTPNRRSDPNRTPAIPTGDHSGPNATGMNQGFTEAALNPDAPHSARVWNYWLGGKDNFAADRQLGDQIKQAFPDIVEIARESRNFLGRAVRYLANEAGIRQFLDIGTGLPTADNTHEVAQRVAPESRIVYVDNDPLVLVHARALLTGSPEGATDYIEADVNEPDAILAGAARTLDFSQPVALMMFGILGNVVDYKRARAIVDRLVSAVSVGSYLVVNDGTNVINPDARNEATRISIEAGAPYISRKPDQIAGYFHGLDLVDPGIVSSSRWRPDTDTTPPEVDVFCGVARKR